jgi:type I restriction enzyme M protein
MSYGDYPSAWLRTGSEQLTYLLFLKTAEERTKPVRVENPGKFIGYHRIEPELTKVGLSSSN